MNIADLVKEAYETSKAKGWWSEAFGCPQPALLGAKIALIHSELSEALECVRDGMLDAQTIEGKPEGLPSELADVMIRVADLAGALGIDLDKAVTEKLAYNTTRTHRHGGRLL